MTQTINAVYEGGVLRPLQSLGRHRGTRSREADRADHSVLCERASYFAGV